MGEEHNLLYAQLGRETTHYSRRRRARSEPWEGTRFIPDHENTNVNFSTIATNPYQWDWFAERSEHSTDLDWADEGWNTTKVIDWWTNDSSLTYNNRYNASYLPEYYPYEGRHGYKDWVRQYVEWSTQNLSMPIVNQELLYPLSSGKVATEGDKANYTLRARFFNQSSINFFENGGDGIFFWTLTHDNYYWSTAQSSYAGKMDDGFAFYARTTRLSRTRASPSSTR